MTGSAAVTVGSVKIGLGLANFSRGIGQVGEALDEGFNDASFRNLLGIAPFGQKFDDPLEPSPSAFFSGVANDFFLDPLETVTRTTKDFFAIGDD